MAVLTDTARNQTMLDCIRSHAKENITTNLTKPEWRTVINSLDDYFNANKAVIAATIPVGIRSRMSNAEIALGAVFVISRRYLDGS